MIALLSGVLSAIAQIFLKKSSCIERKSRIREYINGYVLGGYGITIACMILMIIAYKGLPFKYGAILESLVYLYTMLSGRIIFKEKVTVKRIMGNIIIVCGVAIFSL